MKRVELKQKQHPRMKNWSGDEKKGATDGRPSHKQSAKTKLKVEGSRTVWGTMHSTSVSALSNAIKSLSDVDVNTLVIKYKYKSKWWFVIRGQESTLKILDENWELVALHTNWKLQPLLRFDGTVNDPTATSDGASKDAAGEIGPEIETVGTSKTQIIVWHCEGYTVYIYEYECIYTFIFTKTHTVRRECKLSINIERVYSRNVLYM